MLSQRWRPLFFSLIALLAIWGLAFTGYTIAKHSRVTSEKVRAYVESVDLSKLSPDARARAIQRLANMLNALSPEDRRQARMERIAWGWFGQMTEEEKAAFIDATMPTGFKQMLASFEQLPEEKRRRAIDDALRRLKESQQKLQSDGPAADAGATNAPPGLSQELQAKV